MNLLVNNKIYLLNEIRFGGKIGFLNSNKWPLNWVPLTKPRLIISKPGPHFNRQALGWASPFFQCHFL